MSETQEQRGRERGRCGSQPGSALLARQPQVIYRVSLGISLVPCKMRAKYAYGNSLQPVLPLTHSGSVDVCSGLPSLHCMCGSLTPSTAGDHPVPPCESESGLPGPCHLLPKVPRPELIASASHLCLSLHNTVCSAFSEGLG